MPTVRDVTIALMRELGMTTVFGNPGSTELPMFRDFPADFRYVMGLQESAVLGMADGYAQGTRSAALINLHSSAGVGHALGNLFTAYKNQTPLVVTAGQQVCVVESVKAASDIYTPISGAITEVNEALSANPALLNTDPFGDGWIFRIALSAPEEVAQLKTPAQYREQLSAAH